MGGARKSQGLDPDMYDEVDDFMAGKDKVRPVFLLLLLDLSALSIRRIYPASCSVQLYAWIPGRKRATRIFLIQQIAFDSDDEHGHGSDDEDDVEGVMDLDVGELVIYRRIYRRRRQPSVAADPTAPPFFAAQRTATTTTSTRTMTSRAAGASPSVSAAVTTPPLLSPCPLCSLPSDSGPDGKGPEAAATGAEGYSRLGRGGRPRGGG